jgi:CRISPR-associated endonuclease Cas1
LTEKAHGAKKRVNVRPPLILSGHGVKLRIDRGTLFVQNGFTHYPQKRETWRFFSGDWRLPSRIVVLDVDGGLSFDALAWLAARDIPLIHINWKGEVVNVTGAQPAAIDPKLARAQSAARLDGKNASAAGWLIGLKIANGLATLREVVDPSPAVNAAVAKLESYLSELQPSLGIERVKGLEGKAAAAYFAAWHELPVKWSGTARHPIPDDWHWVGRRASRIGSGSRPNRNASHPIQAMFNYAYAILETQVRSHVLAAGLDPTVGILHSHYQDKLPLVYDLMEPLRPLVDQRILALVAANVFVPADFAMQENGQVRLNPQLARHLVAKIDMTLEAIGVVDEFRRRV